MTRLLGGLPTFLACVFGVDKAAMHMRHFRTCTQRDKAAGKLMDLGNIGAMLTKHVLTVFHINTHGCFPFYSHLF
jgi:hypothetical protein